MYTEKESKSLPVKQENFCHLYLELGNASAAYRQSFDCTHMSSKSIVQEAWALKNSPKVKARITQLQTKLRAKADINKKNIIDHLEAIIDSNITNYLDFDGKTLSYKDFKKLPKEHSKAIESIKPGKYGIELKLHSKSWAIERLCKLLGYDAPLKNELTGKDGESLLPVADLSKLTAKELHSYHKILEKAHGSERT